MTQSLPSSHQIEAADPRMLQTFHGLVTIAGTLIAIVLATAAAGDDVTDLPSSAPRFVEERVHLDLRPGVLRVTGEYVFLGQGGSKEFPIFYPFPCDDEFGAAELLYATVSHGSVEEPLAVVCASDGCHFALPPVSRDTCTVRLAYRQAVFGLRAIYILKSTQEWHAPLDRAEFRLTLAPGLAETLHVNYPFRLCEDKGDSLTFEFISHRFLPDRDLEISF